MRAVLRPPLSAVLGDVRRDPPARRPPRRGEPRGGWWRPTAAPGNRLARAGLLGVLVAACLPATGLSPNGGLHGQEVGIAVAGARSETLLDPLGGTLQVTFRERERVAVRLGYTLLGGSEHTLVVPTCPDFVFCLTVIPWEARSVSRVQQAAVSAPVTLFRGERATLRVVPGVHLGLLRMESRSRFPEARWNHRQTMWGGALGVEGRVRPVARYAVELHAGVTRAGLRALGEGMADGRHYSSIPLTRVEVGVGWVPRIHPRASP
jgi:hypothetical protein